MECCRDSCKVPAAVAVYWPSSKGPRPMCEPHAQWAAHIADAMGFQLPLGNLMVLLEPLAQEVEEALLDDDSLLHLFAHDVVGRPGVAWTQCERRMDRSCMTTTVEAITCAACSEELQL